MRIRVSSLLGMLVVTLGVGQTTSTSQVSIAMDRAVYPRYAPALITITATGPLPVLPVVPAVDACGAELLVAAPPRGWVLATLLVTPDSAVVDFLSLSRWQLPQSRQEAARTASRVIARNVAALGLWQYPAHFVGRNRFGVPLYRIEKLTSITDARARLPTPMDDSTGVRAQGGSMWYPREAGIPQDTFAVHLQDYTNLAACMTEIPGDYELHAAVTTVEGESLLAPRVEFRVLRPAGPDSVAAELFRRSEILETAFGYSGSVSERAFEAASTIVEQYGGSPYVPYCRYVRGQWLYGLAELTAARHENAKVLISVDGGPLMRPFCDQDSVSFADAREEFERVLEFSEDIRAVTETSRWRVGETYLNEGKGREAAEAFIRFGIGAEALEVLESTMVQHRADPSVPLYMDFEARVRGTEECVKALKERVRKE